MAETKDTDSLRGKTIDYKEKSVIFQTNSVEMWFRSRSAEWPGGCKTVIMGRSHLSDTLDGPVLNRTPSSFGGSFYFLVVDDLTLNM